MKRGTALRTTLRGVIRNSHVESLTAIFSGQITLILADTRLRYLPPPHCVRAGRRRPDEIFNSVKWNRESGGGSSDGGYTFNFLTRELAVSVAKDTLAVPEPHMRSSISSLISLSDDGQALYVTSESKRALRRWRRPLGAEHQVEPGSDSVSTPFRAHHKEGRPIVRDALLARLATLSL